MSGHALLLVARVAGWLIVPLYMAGACAYYLLTISAGFWDGDAVVDNVAGVMLSVGFGAFAVVGALLVVRRPTNAIGWILAAVGLMVSIFNADGGYAAYVMATRGRPDVLAVFGAWVANCYWFLMLALALIYLPMLFPDSRLLSRRWLPVAVIGGSRRDNQLVGIVRQTIQPAHVSLWLRATTSVKAEQEDQPTI
jgi:hypothetical protein